MGGHNEGTCNSMKKILFIYPSMLLGGSTTSLLSLLNNLDPDRYQIDLQLRRNTGVLFHDIPKHVNILPQAEKYPGKKGYLIKYLKFIFGGYFFKSVYVSLKNKKFGISSTVFNEFLAKSVSKKNKTHYDYAIGFLEGWSNSYLAYNVCAEKKYAWLHSTFANITSDPKAQISWMKKVDRIVFVTDSCKNDFKKALPVMSDKAITVENITDSSIIRSRSARTDLKDVQYLRFSGTDCFKIITVCRITIDTKGLDRIVGCAKKLVETNIPFLWYIVGDGEDKEQLQKMINDEKLNDCLVLIGSRFNPYPFIKEADIMCMPSRYEGKPMVITESMILGVPPVVTEYLSAHEQIQDSIDGIVVPNHDEAIVDAVLDCMKNSDKLSKMKAYLKTHEYGNREYVSIIEKNLFS